MRQEPKTYLSLSVPRAEKKTSANLLSSLLEYQAGVEEYGTPKWKPDCLGRGTLTRCRLCHSAVECFQLFGGD